MGLQNGLIQRLDPSVIGWILHEQSKRLLVQTKVRLGTLFNLNAQMDSACLQHSPSLREHTMAHEKNHDYHILPPSIWPFVGAVSAFIMLVGAILWMHDSGPWIFMIGFVGVLYVMYAWWSDVIVESHSGDHTPVVSIGLRYGFILFIISEVMFFVA